MWTRPGLRPHVTLAFDTEVAGYKVNLPDCHKHQVAKCKNLPSVFAHWALYIMQMYYVSVSELLLMMRSCVSLLIVDGFPEVLIGSFDMKELVGSGERRC